MVVEIVLNLLTELVDWQVVILEHLDEILNFYVFILFERLLSEIDHLLALFGLFVVLLQE